MQECQMLQRQALQNDNVGTGDAVDAAANCELLGFASLHRITDDHDNHNENSQQYQQQ